MRHNSKQFRADSCCGFTLVEVLVAVVVLSIGIFGLIGLQTAALKNNQEAYLRSQATVLIYDIADKMRSNMGADYTTASAVSHATSCVSYSGAATSCTATQIAERDLYEWDDSVSTILPSGSWGLSVSGGITSVTVNWDDDRDSATSDAVMSMEFRL